MSDSILVTGGRPLAGEVTIFGAKNTVPKNMLAALLSDQPSQLANVSNIEDVPVYQVTSLLLYA